MRPDAPQTTPETNALADVRRAFARDVLTAAGVREDAALAAAFAAVPREDHLPTGPWRRIGGFGVLSLSHDPRLVYRDALFALDERLGINNGQPSLHASWLHAAAIRPGARVAHIGAGTGYYTAVIAHLVGPSGAVVAVERDERLAALARASLAADPVVTLVQGDGALWPREPVDCVYVNFAVERPAPVWLDRLSIGGRLIVPLTPAGREEVAGVGLLVRRLDADRFSARALERVRFIHGRGEALTAAPPERAALGRAFARGGLKRIRALIRGAPADPAACWHVGEGWALSFDPP
jgi:protein-L-isoaspartate(D-aspartate) O-methyltransferase